jgi:hypothetical protein
MGRARDIANVLSSSTNIALDSELGLSLITPTSISVGSGSGSISSTGAVSFTGASSIALNNCFSSTYRNYKIILNATSSTSATTRFRWTSGGTPNSTTSSYSTTYLYGSGVSASSATEVDNNAIFGSIASSTISGNNTIDVFAPFLTEQTAFFSSPQESGGSISLRSGYHNQSTSYDGFVIILSGGTITGTIRVYGYRN